MTLFGKKSQSAPVPPKPERPQLPPDRYTMLLGLALLFFVTAVTVLGLNWYWYQSSGVLPMNWGK